MTRLTRSHIEATRAQLAAVDDLLRERVNTGLLGVALRVVGLTENDVAGWVARRVAVIPVTAGEGTISGFSDMLRAIAVHIGFEARVTGGSDVAGVAEAWADGDDIAVMADDSRFIAIHTRSGWMADNDRATGEGFAALLAMMAGGVAGHPCGVLGCGPVGGHAAFRLAKEGGHVTLCDTDEFRCRALARRLKQDAGSEARFTDSVADVLATCPFIVDATPAAGIISADMVRPDTIVAAPGVPVGATPAAVEKLGTRFYHDNLPLGVAVMLVAAASGSMVETRTKG